jgi:preprotein translocase YajC subunit
MTRLLADSSISPTQWVLLALIVGLIILYPIFTVYRNKKEREKFDQLARDLKVGDKILTSSGTYGEIVAIDERETGKVLTLKTGNDAHVGYLSVDILTVYTVFRDPQPEPLMEEKQEIVEKVEPVKEEKTEVKKEVKKEEIAEGKKTTKAKTSSSKKTSNKSTK